MKQFVLTEKDIKNINDVLWGDRGCSIDQVIEKDILSCEIIERTTHGCLCDCCMATECVRNSGRGYPLVKEE